MSINIKATWAMIITCVLWGLSFVSIKAVVGVIGPIALAYYRFVIATAVLFLMIRLSRSPLKIKTPDIPMFITSGFAGIVAYYYFQNTGIKLISASEASIVIASIPVFTLIAVAIKSKTKLSATKFALVIASFIGVYIMIGASSIGQGSTVNWLGYGMMLGAVLSWVLYGITSKPLTEKYPQLTVVFYQSLFSALMLLGLSLFEPNQSLAFSGTVILNVIYLGVFCSAVTYYLYNYSIKHLGVSTTNLYLNIIPIVTVLSSSLILKETIKMNQIIGGTIVLLSVFFVSISDKKSETQNVNSKSA